MAVNTISNKPYTVSAYCKKLYTSGYLIHTLSKRELKIKYARTFLGIGWMLLQPLVVVTIYTIFFNNIIKIDTQSIPYPQFVLSGLVLWYLFVGIVAKCSYALIESGDLITKVSFPKIIVLISRVIPVIIECSVLLVITVMITIITQHFVGINIIFILFYFLQTIFLAFGIGMLLSIVVLKFRDLVHAIPFIINFGIWLTPVFYPVTIIPDAYKTFFRYCNPLTLSIEGLRSSLFNNQGLSLIAVFLFVFTSLIFIVSSFLFIKFEKRIVENL